jgi:ABC-type sugar transport system substrate-binding protein
MKRLKFVLSLITSDNDYQVEQARAAQEVARRLDVDLEVLFADSDALNQSQQLLTAIQSRSTAAPDGILMEPAGTTGLPVVAQAAATAGIGWVVLSRNAEYLTALRKVSTTPVFSVRLDHEEVGRIQGRQFAAILPEGGAVLYIQGPAGSSVSQERLTGMFETKPENIRIKILKSANWTEGSGSQAISSWLRLSTAHKEEIHLVGCQNDSIALGARKAFQEHTSGSEREGRLGLPFTGVDGLPKTGQEWVRRRILAATTVTPPASAPALELMVSAVRDGRQVPESTLIEPHSFPEIDVLAAKFGTHGTPRG